LSAKIVSYQPESPLSRILGTCATAAASSMVRRGEIDSKAKAHDLDQKVLECGAQRRLRVRSTHTFSNLLTPNPPQEKLTAGLLRGEEDRRGNHGRHGGGDEGKKEG
jgi:hypothetical protein